MVRIVKCDRCGRAETISGFYLDSYVRIGSSTGHSKSFDLCKKCGEELRQIIEPFMKQKRGELR